MLSNELKSKINKLWDKFWSRGITNPITAIEQISYLLFMRRIDDADTLEKAKATFDEKEYDSIFKGQEDCRWSHFSQLEPDAMLDVVANKAFDFIKSLNDPSQPYSRYMENATFIIKNSALLNEAVLSIDELFQDIKQQQDEGQQFQDTQGDLYEYLIDEMGSGGKNGQFRTPRHLIQLMCEIIDPDLTDKICDPACGTGGFLVGAYQYILTKYTSPKEIIKDENGLKRFKRFGGDKIRKQEKWQYLWEKAFFGFDVDQTMVRIGLMNLMLHGIKIPQIENTDSLSKKYDKKYKDGEYSVILANPPFTGRVDKGGISDELKITGTNSELLFLIRISKMLCIGGKAAVIIPEGVLFGGSKAHTQTKEILLKDNKLEAVISLPSGAFKPYTGVKTSILIFTKAEEESPNWHTEKVWFYELKNDGYSLDDNRKKLAENPLPIARDAYKNRATQTPIERTNHFYVPISEIQENGLDLSYNRYKKFEYEEQTYESPQKILETLYNLEDEILKDMEDLKNLIE
ncbi:type I restriction-modification system subunit M [Nonlabens marinus]|uniref:site-specific DNA-methyltransferase (adenine-specific) n=1 Tax=Nonlabens marinus S1-08 TaxID=1454201 RepID=W8VNU2_9FLAO|nr:class I SAM-dependent DNA methyltransferase [Nonlabens marinus]BAO54075.1 type I restriction-modification system, DNA-methyltransferase subunit M [Nonlabens marinus S1-08]